MMNRIVLGLIYGIAIASVSSIYLAVMLWVATMFQSSGWGGPLAIVFGTVAAVGFAYGYCRG